MRPLTQILTDIDTLGYMSGELAEELSEHFRAEAAVNEQAGNTNMACKCRFLAEVLPVFRAWMQLEISSGVSYSDLLDATANGLSNLAMNALHVSAVPGQIQNNTNIFLRIMSRTMINVATLIASENHGKPQ